MKDSAQSMLGRAIDDMRRLWDHDNNGARRPYKLVVGDTGSALTAEITSEDEHRAEVSIRIQYK